MRTLKISVNSPTHKTTDELTQEDVWGKFSPTHEKLSDGMIVSRTGDTCIHFGDLVPYKSVTVVCEKEQVNDVSYWLEYVHGGNSISNTKEIGNNKVAIRSDYQCW